jgi:UDP-N-acetylglucosamine 1-carboxyvinyltransferase
MECIFVNGGRALQGSVAASGAKNSALAIMTATLLSSGAHRISGVPDLRDITTMKRLLEHLGVHITGGNDLTCDATHIDIVDAPYELVKTMRASFLVLGPLLARFGNARVSLPGGCAIGLRPVDIHIKAFEAMGADIKIENGYVHAACERMHGAHILLDMPTVGGTENIMMAACLADGVTVIENAAREPEISDLALALRSAGARITGDGTGTITIEGVKELSPITHTVMPDRIEAGTLLIAGAITSGDVTVENCPVEHMGATLEKLREIGCKVDVSGASVRIRSNGSLQPVEVITSPYPGFPTDMQAQLMSLLTLAGGTSLIRETVFENRFIHVAELDRMGAHIRVERDCAVVTGVEQLEAARVMASDLRASASLILAGLAARGTTVVSRIYHLDRGYEALEKKLQHLGADIRRGQE